MTAQKLTASTSTDSHKAFRQALQLKSNSEKPYGRETGPMPIPQQQQQQQQQQQAKHNPPQDALQAERPQAWAVPNSVEPDSQQEKQQQQQQQQQQAKRHQHLTVVTDTDADATMPPAADADAGGGGAAIPMSPPSSPTHVVAAHSQDQPVVTTPAPASDATKHMPGDLPPVVAPSPTSAAAPQGATAVAVADAAAAAPQGAQAPAPVPAVPIRLGRGRKLCPNCKALTKSAVKQCRECKHVFNPVSQRLRAQHREPKENEEVPMLPRRRHRPSQRLLESLVVEPEEPSQAATAAAAAAAQEGEGQAPSSAHPTRRPLGSASNSGGGGNSHRVMSAGGGADPKAHTPAAASKEQQPPKRSHKRKNPLPPGVAPPKRKKGAAAAARLAAQQATRAADPGLAADTGATLRGGILPILTLPEQQRVAQDLLASPTPSRHTVPESPELAPMASPAGPLLFMASSSASNLSSSCALEDDAEWLSRGNNVGGGGGGGGVGVGGTVSPTTAFVEQQLQQQQQQQQQLFAPGAATSLPGLLLDDDDDDDDEVQQQQQQHVFPVRRQDGVGGVNSDLSTEGQDKDPFADVEMWWEGGGVAAAVVNPAAVTPSVAPAFPMVGRNGTMQQRVVFPHNTTTSTNTELLGDTEDALLWNPLRASSAGGGPTAAAGTAGTGRSLTLWPGSSNNDNHLLLSADSSSSSASSFHSHANANANHSPSQDSAVYPTFERGAAIASAVAAPAAGGSSGGSSSSSAHGHGRAEFLLAEASCSSLPDPLVFGGNGTAVAAVSADSCGGHGGDSTEGVGGFWNPLFPTGGMGSS